MKEKETKETKEKETKEVELYKEIFQRRAVRKYDMTPLPQAKLKTIKKYADSIKQMEGQSVRFEIVDQTKVSSNVAPHFILAYCKQTTLEFINAGYTMQKLDLYLQSIGLGSLYLGMATPKDKPKNEEFCIMMAFGQTSVEKRSSVEEFKRLPVSEIANVDNQITKAARLAPSAMNSQPWHINFTNENVTIKYQGRGLLQSLLKKKKSKIDIGIITRHIELALINSDATINSVLPYDEGKGGFGVAIRFTNNLLNVHKLVK